VDLLERAKSFGTKLIVAINSDESVRAIKGPGRPVQREDARRSVLLGLKAVDEVLIFDARTPEEVIKSIRPDVLVKGGDWKIDEIIGADFVQSYGGKVLSLPLIEGFSSTSIIDQIAKGPISSNGTTTGLIHDSIEQHIAVFRNLAVETTASIDECLQIILSTFKAGKKVLLCGNGGSAADAQHIAAEFVGRYESERRALPAIALTTDTSAITALANDYDFERIFSRQVDALATEGDCLIAISTSGNSRNVISAVMSARSLGCKVVGMTGSDGRKLSALCDASVLVPSKRTARIQEAHITIAHIWCEMIDAHYAGNSS